MHCWLEWLVVGHTTAWVCGVVVRQLAATSVRHKCCCVSRDYLWQPAMLEWPISFLLWIRSNLLRKSQQWWAAMQNHPCKQHYHNHKGILRNSIKTIGQHDITMAIAWHNRWHHNCTIVNDVKSAESDWITVTGFKTTLTLILPTTSDIFK